MGKKYIIDLNPDCVEGEYLRIPARIAGEEQWLVTKAALTPYTEPDTNEAYQRGVEDGAKSVENWNEQEKKLRMDEAYRRGYETAKHECEDCRKIRADAEQELADKAYQRGLNDAWEAARKIYLPSEYGGIHADVKRQIFNNTSASDIFKKVSASEAIKKIRQYEQEQEQDGLRQNIQTIVDQCGYTLDEIAAVLAKMKEES